MQSEGLGLPEKVEESWHIDLLGLSFFQIFLFLPLNFHHLHLCVGNIYRIYKECIRVSDLVSWDHKGLWCMGRGEG